MRSGALPRRGIPVTLPREGLEGEEGGGAATSTSALAKPKNSTTSTTNLPVARRLLKVMACPPSNRHRYRLSYSLPSSNCSLPAAMRVFATSTATKNVAPTQKLHPPHRSNPFSAIDSDSCWEGDSSTESLSDTYTDPDTEAGLELSISNRDGVAIVCSRSRNRSSIAQTSLHGQTFVRRD
jgi:hypothetical protein